MICKITGGRYSFKKHTVLHETFNVELTDYTLYDTRFSQLVFCFIMGFKECAKRGLDFEKLEIIFE